jgi:hypothetical protein
LQLSPIIQPISLFSYGNWINSVSGSGKHNTGDCGSRSGGKERPFGGVETESRLRR